MSMALSRSTSVTGGMFRKGRPQSIARSNTTRQTEPREALAERLKDVEDQRDALHSALKSLLERQELQNRENTKRIRQLEMERDRLLTASPTKAGYEREVSKLREEISVLRRRAEEAIEQKWQVEKGLGGLKMDLDRAEEEIASLRSLLKENEILIPARGSHTEHDMPVSSASLEKAYQDLQAAYTEALRRIKTLEESAMSDEKTQLAMQRLEQALSAAVSDRDLARADASSYRIQLDTLETLEKNHLDAERNLADQLHESAQRVEELARQVRAHLEANATLRARLGDTIARGEAEQRFSTERIAGMQSRLRTLEDQVVAAQTGAEERVTRHEEELGRLREAHSTQLQRLRDASGGLRAGQQRLFPPKSPLSPMFSSRFAAAAKSPTRMSTPAGLTPHVGGVPRPGIRRSMTEPLDMVAQVETLKGRVAELEGALAAADAEMQEVVGRMNTAQIEVMTLQEEREDAVRETRRLQVLLQGETMKVFEERFRSLGSRVG
jgi:chromosome segregation ATPase